ncbi:hypothetical protein H8R17_30400 [Streptomyces sp. TRM68367]|nr:hypothetical protein [Streptomyces sp. TRM68367]
MGKQWRVGISSYDGSVPVPRDETEKAASMIGQGRVQANPLIMASVTATAASGEFQQPTIVPGGGDRTAGTTPLPRPVVSQLRELMRATVTEGTASSLPVSVPQQSGRPPWRFREAGRILSHVRGRTARPEGGVEQDPQHVLDPLGVHLGVDGALASGRAPGSGRQTRRHRTDVRTAGTSLGFRTAPVEWVCSTGPARHAARW